MIYGMKFNKGKKRVIAAHGNTVANITYWTNKKDALKALEIVRKRGVSNPRLFVVEKLPYNKKKGDLFGTLPRKEKTKRSYIGRKLFGNM